ncbi:hypothetical protein Ahy_B01g055150 isoform A [Arachis hypogaea]|uniref:Uncharacterized protein n=1 Tax=Arachis hypogaea TaxID=3818 RepID=A0A445AVA2_ARAHY|nr:hypothetical protein Ahy_B01g055150 isoform A [Arachis hypogaea]
MLDYQCLRFCSRFELLYFEILMFDHYCSPFISDFFQFVGVLLLVFTIGSHYSADHITNTNWITSLINVYFSAVVVAFLPLNYCSMFVAIFASVLVAVVLQDGTQVQLMPLSSRNISPQKMEEELILLPTVLQLQLQVGKHSSYGGLVTHPSILECLTSNFLGWKIKVVEGSIGDINDENGSKDAHHINGLEDIKVIFGIIATEGKDNQEKVAKISNYEKELDEIKHMTRQEFVVAIRRFSIWDKSSMDIKYASRLTSC